MKRVGALLGAVAMVVAALVLRSTFSGDDDGGNGGGDATRILCPVEFAEICADAATAETEVAGTTADRLIEATTADDLGADAWIVPAAWARLVIDERARLDRPPLFEVQTAVASSPVMLVVWSDRADQLEALCPAVDWRCLSDQDGAVLSGGDRVETGAPSTDSATGLTVAVAQAANLLGRSDFAANDFDGPFQSGAGRLADRQLVDPVRAMRTEGPGRLTAAGVVAADATNLTTNFGTLTPIEVAPGVRADVVVLVPLDRTIGDRRLGELGESFVAAGWEPPATGGDGLPGGGVIAAIRTLWTSF